MPNPLKSQTYLIQLFIQRNKAWEVQLSFAHNWMDDVTDGRALPHMDARCIAHPPLCFVTMCQLQPSSGWAGLD